MISADKTRGSAIRVRDVPPTFHVQPLTLKPRVLASNPQVSKSGVRASDKGFLGMAWSEASSQGFALSSVR